jgi:HD superfamily phosphodiesterase
MLKRLKRELPADLYYHSYYHILDVYHSAVRLARAEGFGIQDQRILYTAVLVHDAGFTKTGHSYHEETSCTIAKKILPKYNYTSEQIDHVCEMVMSTKIPQSPQDKLAEVLCDADLDYLGRDDFDEISHSLYKEMKAYNLVNDMKTWNRIQVNFLSSHTYFTKTARLTREKKKNSQLKKLMTIVDGYDSN